MKELIGAVVGAIIGAMVGAGAWLGIDLGAGVDAGWMAIVVGALAGVGARIGGAGLNGTLAGLIAVALAFAFMLVCTTMRAGSAVIGTIVPHERDPWVLSNLAQMVAHERNTDEFDQDILAEAKRRFGELAPQTLRRYRGFPPAIAPDYARIHMAHDVAEEYATQTKALDWPTEAEFGSAWLPHHFPPNLWADVQRRWESMTPLARQDYTRAVEAQVNHQVEQYYRLPGSSDPTGAAQGGFSALDLLWYALGLVIAYVLASTTG